MTKQVAPRSRHGLQQTRELEVYEVVIFDGLGKRTAIDFHKLTLDDGSRAFDQQPDVLFRALKKMAVPGIRVDMGSHDLLLCLGRHRVATAVDQNGKLISQAEGSAA
jgi:hypothetical protein